MRRSNSTSNDIEDAGPRIDTTSLNDRLTNTSYHALSERRQTHRARRTYTFATDIDPQARHRRLIWSASLSHRVETDLETIQMAKLLAVLVTMSALVVSFGLIGLIQTVDVGSLKTDEDIQAWVEKEVQRSEKLLPQDCGNGVTWVAVDAGPNAVNYKYKIEASTHDIIAAQTQIEQALKSNFMLKWMIPKEVTAYCSLYDQDGAFATRLTLQQGTPQPPDSETEGATEAE
ncbi:MAG: hypothetical protein KDB27_35060 [Planctomycetales bacterium]|nr:hypothetical protein [Planctomycetales bacterium]